MTRISESELILPVLYILSKANATTRDLIRELIRLLHPTGEDLEILEGKNDGRFSQKVRNLKAHKTLTRMELAEEGGVQGGASNFQIVANCLF